MMRNVISRSRGVALMEVLVAVTILGAGMGVALGSLSNSARLQSTLSKKEIARELAQGQLVTLEIAGALAQPGVTAGAFDPPNDAYTWKLRVEASLANPDRRRIELSVSLSGDKAALYSLNSYVLD